MQRHLPICLAVAVSLTGSSLVSFDVSALTATGAIVVSVTISAMRGAPLATSAYGRRDVGPKPPARGPETGNVVVYLVVGAPSGAEPMRVRIVQRDEQFQPQVTAITAGSSVE